MRKIVIGAIGAIALALCAATPARANWQFTKWGMTKEEFKKANSTIVIESNRNQCETLLDLVTAIGTNPEFIASSWEAGRFKFTNCYVFGENDSLSEVYLVLEDFYSSNSLLDGLVAKYGEPSFDKSIEMLNITAYEWRTNSDLIVFSKRLNPGSSRTYIRYSSIQPILAQESKL